MAKRIAKETLLVRLAKAPDLETHLRLVEVDGIGIEGIGVVEIRDYIPSLAEYGRGYWFTMDDENSLRKIGNALIDLADKA